MTRAAAFLSATLLAASLGVAQNTSTSGTASHQNTAPGNIATQNQNTAAATGLEKASQNPGSAPTTTEDIASPDEIKESGVENPTQNSTALQLLGLIGVGSLIAGFFMRR
ncbi:MAG TPA: hypothetical protein VFA74_11780 [Terriglobales bacterium]|nr:hypothetical protein [Terriglobales bacterium]